MLSSKKIDLLSRPDRESIAMKNFTSHEAQERGRPTSIHSEGPSAEAPGVRVVALPELSAEVPLSPGKPLLHDVHPLHQVRTHVQVSVGQATITVGELLSARENQVLKLDRAVDDVVDLLVEGKVIARGQLVAVDQFFAVRITQLPVALQLTNDPIV